MDDEKTLKKRKEKNGKTKLKDVERDEIAILKEKGYSLRKIAGSIERSVSTISDEIKRNKTPSGKYVPRIAKQKAYVRRKYARFQGMKIVNDPALKQFVEEKLLEGRSPESIAGRIRRREKHLKSISADSIERFLRSVHGRKIEARRNKFKRKGLRHKRRILKKLDGRKFIDSRPKIANRRGRVGDCEADFIVSGKTGKGHLLVVADRKLRTSFIEKILPVSIKNVHLAFQKIKTRYGEMLTITTDNDLLLAHHKELEELLGVTIYFCHAYSSWEKGTVENTNGVIREYIPKGSDISKYSKRFIREVEEEINDRYLECIDSRTPQEAIELHRKRKSARRARRDRNM